MPMYVLQVMTGQETSITDALRRVGMPAYCPQETRSTRRGGAWRDEVYTLYPGYVFVEVEDVMRCYYAVRSQYGVVCWLGMHSGAPVALAEPERERILWMAKDGPLPPSVAVPQPDGTLRFTEGPLLLLEGRILHIDRHDRRAVVSLPVAGERKRVNLSFKIPESEYITAAGTPRGGVPEDTA